MKYATPAQIGIIAFSLGFLGAYALGLISISNGQLVNFEKYRAIRVGMTFDQVEDKLGATGSWNPSKKEYQWWNDYRSTGMAARFENNRLVDKHSIGNLR